MGSGPWAMGSEEEAAQRPPLFTEFLLSYGAGGDLGRFRAAEGLSCRRGDLVVVGTRRGIELATVLCPARDGHARLLPDPHVGELLRLATFEDGHTAEERLRDSQRLFEDSRRLAAELKLPLEILDAEILLDGGHAILYHLCATACATELLVNRLAREHGFRVSLHDLALPAPAEEEHEHGGCGAENCGKGGCGSCGSGSCSTCGMARRTAVNHPEPETERRINLASCG